MKKYLTILILVAFARQAAASGFYDQLCEFNPNWKKYAAHFPDEETRVFLSDRDYIQAHLSRVLVILRTNPTSDLTSEQLDSRKHLIGLLDEYRIAGRFPMNYYRNERIPVFIDEHQTHCAVGFLMQQTGHEALAQHIAATDNYVWVKDIHEPGLADWQFASGFTLEELKLIQGAYDFYMPNAFILPNKHEIPQKPDCIVAYFDDQASVKNKKAERAIWCRGEGRNGILNGRWEQNYAPGVPWIVGWYENGKRSGQWEEYYQGTGKLCRTECWRNDKLNGIRRRFDRAGRLIEEILFRDGKAVTKTNFDLAQELTWVRKPIDSTLVRTEVYTSGGALIASGHEKVYNPGNLLWFQNIELTALNSIAVSARSALTNDATFNDSGFAMQHLYNSPPLVEYRKEGDWMYYREYNAAYAGEQQSLSVEDMLNSHYKHFGYELVAAIGSSDNMQLRMVNDSLRVSYSDNYVQNFYVFGANNYVHLCFRYYEEENIITGAPVAFYRSRKPVSYLQQSYSTLNPVQLRPVRIQEMSFGHSGRQMKEIGQYNEKHQRVGTWKYFDRQGQLYKTETFIIPRDEEEELMGSK